MEDYYIKVGRKYVRVGYNLPDMHDGLYYREKNRTTSVAYWHGRHIPQPINIPLLIEIMRKDDKLSKFLYNIQDENSEEFKQMKENSGGYVKEPPKVYNISAQDLSLEILRFIYKCLESSH